HLVFVETPGAQTGDKKLPEPGPLPPPHRHSASVPIVEIADDAGPLRIGRPHRKGDPLDALVNDPMGAEFAIAGEMVALAQQVQIELAEHRLEAVDIVELALYTAARDAQPIAERLLPVGQHRDKEAALVNTAAEPGDGPGRRVDDLHFLRSRQHRADD